MLGFFRVRHSSKGKKRSGFRHGFGTENTPSIRREYGKRFHTATPGQRRRGERKTKQGHGCSNPDPNPDPHTARHIKTCQRLVQSVHILPLITNITMKCAKALGRQKSTTKQTSEIFAQNHAPLPPPPSQNKAPASLRMPPVTAGNNHLASTCSSTSSTPVPILVAIIGEPPGGPSYRFLLSIPNRSQSTPPRAHKEFISAAISWARVDVILSLILTRASPRGKTHAAESCTRTSLSVDSCLHRWWISFSLLLSADPTQEKIAKPRRGPVHLR